MLSAILLSLFVVASADKMKIVNNCGMDYKIGTMNIPSGTGVLCTPLVDFPADTDAEVEFFPNEDILVLQGAAVATSSNLNLGGLLEVVIEGQEDVDGKCAELYAYDTAVYSVESGVPVITLCVNEPEDESGADPTAEVPPSPDAAFSPSQAPETAPEYTEEQTTIENKCSNDFDFSQIRVNPNVNVVCSPALTIHADDQFSYEPVGISYLAVKTMSTKDTPNFEYLGTLQAIIDLEGDADGECQKLVNSGYTAVYAPINAQMTLCVQ